MKAAIIHQFGQTPRYEDFPDPVAGEGQTLIQVKAAVLENFDKATVAGTHYSSQQLFPRFPAVVGTDGVGMTTDGKLVAFGNIPHPYGAFAEKTVAGYIFPVPDGIDAASATAIPPSVLTSLLPLKYSAKMSPGETVLINGATGVSGRIAVQVAKMLGAGKIVGSGRNQQSLELLLRLGADEVIDLRQPDKALGAAFIKAGGENGYDVVLDFLWGHPAEVLLGTFIPTSVGFAKKRIRYIQIGEKAGTSVAIPASVFRTSGLEMMGVGVLSHEVLLEEMGHIWEGIKAGRFFMDIEQVLLKDIGKAWERNDLQGKRLVVVS